MLARPRIIGEETLYNSDSDYVTITEQGVEPLPVPSVVVQCIIAEGVNTDESPCGAGAHN